MTSSTSTSRVPSGRVVLLANDKVPITTVCRLLGVDVPETADYGRSVKVRCPFGAVYHSDQGVEPAMRIYLDTNSCYCFSCGWSYNPVRLASRAWDVRPVVAAGRLLEHVGYQTAVGLSWEEVTAYTVVPEHAQLAEALKTYCQRVHSGWSDVQFEPAVAGRLDDCLALLDHVHTDEQAEEWLGTCKRVMQHSLATSLADLTGVQAGARAPR